MRVLSIHGLGFDWRTEQGPNRILRDITFDVASGEVISILGANGCGKTTLLKLIAHRLGQTIAGLVPGLYESCGTVVTGSEGQINAPSLPSPRVGYLPQAPVLFPWLTSYQNVVFPLKSHRVTNAECRAVFDDLANRIPLLTDLAHSRPGELSGGQQQRVALAQILASRPDILLLDEAFSAADHGARVELATAIASLARERSMSVLHVTHDIWVALGFSDRVVALDTANSTDVPSWMALDVSLKSSVLADTEEARLRHAIEPIIQPHQVIDSDEAFRREQAVATSDTVIVVALDPSLEYAGRHGSRVLDIVSQNLRRGVRYNYVFSEPRQWAVAECHGAMPAEVDALLARLRAATGLSRAQLAEQVAVTLVPQEQILQETGVSVFVHRGDGLVGGWSFPMPRGYAIACVRSDGDLRTLGTTVESWRTRGMAAASCQAFSDAVANKCASAPEAALAALGMGRIEADDAAIFYESFRTKENPSYADAWHYVTQAANCHIMGGSPLGYKYHEGDFIVALGYYPRPIDGKLCFHMINPSGARACEYVPELAKGLTDASGMPVYVQKMDAHLNRLLRESGDFVDSTRCAWHRVAGMEDDTVPEVTLVVAKTLAMRDASERNPVKDQYKRFCAAVGGSECVWSDLLGAEIASAQDVVREFFVKKREQGVDISVPSDYENMVSGPPASAPFFRRLLRIGGEAAGLVVVERIGDGDVAGLYCSIGLYHRFRCVSEYIMLEACRLAKELGCSRLNVGGSETEGLHHYKMKFGPEITEHREWIVYARAT
ncbi:MAG: ATP-binding cassette domain-containing protein [Gammaproteobacteria bacterium]|nr:ATP-binding cassette domain-containing protein [Gammaproteobacteria bacterium]